MLRDTAQSLDQARPTSCRLRALRQVCAPKTPLTYTNIAVYRINASGTFNLATWTGTGGTAYTVSANAGVLSSTQARRQRLLTTNLVEASAAVLTAGLYTLPQSYNPNTNSKLLVFRSRVPSKMFRQWLSVRA